MDFARADVIYYGSREGFLGQPAMDRGADITGDGYTDLLISDPYYMEKIGGKLQYRGRVWLMKGGPNLPQMIDVESNAYRIFVPDTRIPGKFGNCWNTGDWNGDGKMDIVIGDHFAGVSEGHIHSGITYMFYNDFSFNCEDFVDYQDQLSSEP